jgi:hypothetical protein
VTVTTPLGTSATSTADHFTYAIGGTVTGGVIPGGVLSVTSAQRHFDHASQYDGQC